jgi:hypothetical protein
MGMSRVYSRFIRTAGYSKPLALAKHWSGLLRSQLSLSLFFGGIDRTAFPAGS